MNIIDGKLIDSNNDLENIKNFIARWQIKIKEIKNNSLDQKSCYHIATDFTNEAIYLMNIIHLNNKQLILTQLGNDLYLALYTSYNKFKKETKSFWRTLFKSLKLPPLHFNF